MIHKFNCFVIFLLIFIQISNSSKYLTLKDSNFRHMPPNFKYDELDRLISKRQTSTNIIPTIEIGLFIDEDCYNEILSKTDHNKSNANHIIFAIINQVQTIYHHQTLQTKVDINISYFSIIRRTSIFYRKLKDHRSNRRILLRFWSFLNQKNNGSNFRNFDMALLLTSSELHSNLNLKSLSTLGEAVFDSICSNTACAVVKYRSGLQIADVIAHEIGHV